MTKQTKIIIWSVVAALAVALTAIIGFGVMTAPTATKATPITTLTTTPTPTTVGTRMPSGFEPESVSFISPHIGFVLGIAHCASGSCLTIARTQDGGTTWISIPAPKAALANGNYSDSAVTGVSRIRFANIMDGYLYGPDLYATHDGGTTWQKIALQGIGTRYVVTALETNGVDTYLIAGTPNTIPSPNYLFISKTQDGVFTQSKANFPTGSATQIIADKFGALVTADNHGSVPVPGLNDKGIHYFQATGTTNWIRVRATCIGGYTPNLLVALAAPISGSTAPQLVLGCGGSAGAGSQEKTVLISSNLKTFTATTAKPPLGGLLNAIASPDGKTIAIAASSGATFIYVSTDGGASWKTAFTDATLGGSPIHDLAFISSTEGVAVVGHATTPGTKNSKLLITHNRGMSWQKVAF